MPTVSWKTVEGGEKGSIVALSVEVMVNKFFNLGVKNIQDECNNVSNKYRIFWSLKSRTDLMGGYNLSVTYRDGCRELESAFELFEPTTIYGKILDSYCPANLKTTAATIQHSIDDPMNPLLTIYAKALQVTDSTTIVWTGFSTSFESIMYHELLHACGDSPILRKEIHDGVIRHTMICSEAINNLLKASKDQLLL